MELGSYGRKSDDDDDVDAGSQRGLRHTAAWRLLARHRLVVQAVIDACAWMLAVPAATMLRYDFRLHGIKPHAVLVMVPLAAALQLAVGAAGGLYLGRWRFGSFDEVAALARSALVVTVALALVNRLALATLIPTSATIGAGILAFVMMAGARYMWRLSIERRLRPSEIGAERVVVFGAGEGGAQVITAMMRNPASPYYPVALLDDDPRKTRLRIMGVPVLGDRRELARVAADQDAGIVVIAIPSAGAALIRELSELAQEAGLSVRVLPPVSELFGASIGVSDIRPLTEADLLGRHEVDTDVDAIAGYLTGRRVMVTGAGGSIGSELCRQIYRYAPAELILVERDESALHAVQLSLEGRALLDSPNLVVCDIRDRMRVREVFAAHRPEVVFHAAALKHLPLLELHPGEAVKTNVFATLSLLDAAIGQGVDRFVNISTDKAADPASVLGYTKRIAERLTAGAAHECGQPYLSVRFGNVLGSRGSVLTTFRAQIDAGGPVTVTDREVTRFFMTVEEAVQLVIQAGAVGEPGEVLVLDMGDPVPIAELARRLVAQAERPIDIVYTGLRPGEKLHETLLGADELDVRPNHHLISQVRVPPLDADAVACLDGVAPAGLVATMRAVCAAPPVAADAPVEQPLDD